uniref:Uncharacterized protein n=1 Tax=Arundo donax TaxID=35708 RepID=A0A0A9AMX8_ARUDO
MGSDLASVPLLFSNFSAAFV